jgi:hypothetical protein
MNAKQAHTDMVAVMGKRLDLGVKNLLIRSQVLRYPGKTVAGRYVPLIIEISQDLRRGFH